jgi:lipoyl(octanoyl) transferase
MRYEKPNLEIDIVHLGTIDFKAAWEIQERYFNKIVEQKLHNRSAEVKVPTKNYLLICEHPLVYTLGKSGKEEHLLLTEAQLEATGAKYYKINRGGDITHHGPGQLVIYPIFDLENFFTDIHLYLRYLEEAVINTLKYFDIEAGKFEGYTGVWIDADKPSARKICAMGIKCGRWVTMHGLALNVNNNLDFFSYIVPCGIKEKDVSSIQKELNGRQITLNEVCSILIKETIKQFGAFKGVEEILNVGWH